MKLQNRIRLLIAVLLTGWVATAMAGSYDIALVDWQQPRSGQMIHSLPAVQEAIAELRSNPGTGLLISHQSDEEGALWGAELHDWLVSLGISPEVMRVQVSDVAPAALRLDVIQGAGQ